MASRLSIADVLSLLNDSHQGLEDEEDSDYDGEGVYSYIPEPALHMLLARKVTQQIIFILARAWAPRFLPSLGRPDTLFHTRCKAQSSSISIYCLLLFQLAKHD